MNFLEGLSPIEWIELLGIPSIVAFALRAVFKNIKDLREDFKNIKAGVQAQLRSQMIADYNEWSEKGYAPIHVRDNFENNWNRYEALGENGVMSDIHDRFMELPTAPKKED
jgi:hypothetical protein